VKFSNDVLKIGTPVKVNLENISATQVDYTWYLDGEKISNTGDSYTPTEDDLEKMLSVTVTADGVDYTCAMYISELPVVYINTDSGEAVASKEEYEGATFKLQGSSEYDDTSQLYDGEISIRGRGNYTWEHEKKPYKIKLDTKTNILGMGESKHWVLLAEYMDYTHLRNSIFPYISEQLGMEYTADMTPVAVVLNGEYNGMYYIAENVRIAENRVNIYDWEETAEDIAKAVYKANKSSGMTKTQRDELEELLQQDLTWVTTNTFTWDGKSYTVSDYVTLPDDITGGYLLELDTYDYYHTKQVSDFETDGQQPIQFKSPEYAVTNDSMYNYAKDYIQAFEDSVTADDYYTEYDGDNLHYSELFDMDSLVKYWFTLELSANCDGMRFSNFMYKDFDSLFKMGPAWDYDWTWNASYVVPTNEWWTSQSYYNDTEHWYKYLTKDPYFIVQAYEQYQEIKPSLDELTKTNGLIDTWASKYEKSAVADLKKWHSDTSYATEVQSLKEYGTARFSWLDEQFSSVETLAKSLGYTSSDKLQVSSITNEDNSVKVTAQVTDDSATGVTFHVNGILVGSSTIENGTATITVPSNLLKEDSTALNTVQIRLVDSDGEYITSSESNDKNINNNRNPWDNWSNWWEEDSSSSTSSSSSDVLSNFATFTTADLGITEVSATLLGDLNCDGYVNILDVTLFKNYTISPNDCNISAVGLKNADLNHDDDISNIDLLMLKKQILNLVD
jgi:hypothetical protein